MSLATQQKRRKKKAGENIYIFCVCAHTRVFSFLFSLWLQNIIKKNIYLCMSLCWLTGCHINNFSPAEKAVGL